MTIDDKLLEAHRLLSEVASYTHDRFTGARSDEKSDHCFGYSLGVVVTSMNDACEAIMRARGQLVYVREFETK